MIIKEFLGCGLSSDEGLFLDAPVENVSRTWMRKVSNSLIFPKKNTEIIKEWIVSRHFGGQIHS